MALLDTTLPLGGTSRSPLTLLMPIGLIGILIILLFPLPTFLLDILLALNITLSLVMLFAALYIERPLQFSTYPALLLVTTLFRLGMNVATTRLILLNGDAGPDAAGEVVQAFGEFVIGGNFTVGTVIFVVISLVNLKVITKGSSRIAEVAARFTLDAMPGKQMAIDSDLNAGLIKEAEARKRRRDLEQEAEFYGSMDGAAKFVAGDAIAGIFITTINIIGGLFIGIFQKNMDWLNAASIYTLLTIGDGLVSQIPSIIISTSAGLIVARASSGKDLSIEVLGQLGSSEKPLLLTSAVCAVFALIPGLPFLPFISLSIGCGTLGVLRTASIKKEGEAKKVSEKKVAVDNAPKPGSTEEVVKLLALDTLELEVGYELVGMVEGDLVERIRSIRRQFAIDYGFIVPPIHIRDNVRITPSEYRVLLKGEIIGKGELKTKHLLAMDPAGTGTTVKGIPTKEPAFGLDAIWITEGSKAEAQLAGLTVVDLSTVVTTHLTELIKAHMADLLGRQEVQSLLDNLAKEYPKVVEDLVPTILSLGQVQQVLTRLLKEQISIRDLRTILETLADAATNTKSPERLTELVRRKFARSICSKLSNSENTLSLVTLNGASERRLTESLTAVDDGSILAIDPATAQVLISRLTQTSQRFLEAGATPVLLVPSQLRPALANFVERFVPGYVVVSHSEVTPQTKVHSFGVISLEVPVKAAA